MRPDVARARAAGLALGFVADRLFGDPQRWHPVAGFGHISARLERRWYGDSRLRGTAHTILLVGAALAVGAGAEALTRHPVAKTLVTAVATWAVLGGRTLEREALAVQTLLDDGDLVGARVHVARLVGRDTTALDESEVARATIESVAENTSDAVVAPLVAGALWGVPGLLAYRAANTLDAMVGHHSDRYERYGWASARLDDLLNLPGSRWAGLLTLLADPGQAAQGYRAWRRDAHRHPSPNAGVVEAAFAGVLGFRLGGTNRYGPDRVEHRASMGGGRAPIAADISRSVLLARRVGLLAVVTAGGGAILRRRYANCPEIRPDRFLIVQIRM